MMNHINLLNVSFNCTHVAFSTFPNSSQAKQEKDHQHSNWNKSNKFGGKILTLWHVHHSHCDSAQNIVDDVRFEIVIRQPFQNRNKTEQRVFEGSTWSERIDVPENESFSNFVG